MTLPARTAKLPASALPDGAAGLVAWLRLARSRRVGPATFIRLLRQFGSAHAALEALPAIAAEAGARDYAPAGRAEAEAEIAAAGAAGARALVLGAPDYPPLLALLADPPPLLWARGDPGVAARAPVALVGARNASALGRRMAARLARGLGAAGHAVASGLARGIDAAAHEAALGTGTVAVLAGGVDVVYPPEHEGLAAAIAEAGLILSEMPMGTPPRAAHFLRRNRIVSGLALGVVVVEAAERSGAINTARNALDQGREVMAVPGHPIDPRAGGCNALIRDGATLVRSAEDVAEALAVATGGLGEAPPAERPLRGADVRGPDVRGAGAREAGVPGATERVAPTGVPAPEDRVDRGRDGTAPALAERLLALIGPVPVMEDALIRSAGAPAAAVAAALVDLELAGAVARHPGGLVSLAAP